MKKLTLILILTWCFCTTLKAQKIDTTKSPHVYWKEIGNTNAFAQELYNRLHQKSIAEKIDSYKMAGLDSLLNNIANLLPTVYRRSYPIDTVKKGGNKP